MQPVSVRIRSGKQFRYGNQLWNWGTQSVYAIRIHSPGTQSEDTVRIRNPYTQSVYTIRIHNPGAGLPDSLPGLKKAVFPVHLLIIRVDL